MQWQRGHSFGQFLCMAFISSSGFSLSVEFGTPNVASNCSADLQLASAFQVYILSDGESGVGHLENIFLVCGVDDSYECRMNLLLCANIHRAFDVELLYIAQTLGVPIREVAVNWTEIEGQTTFKIPIPSECFTLYSAFFHFIVNEYIVGFLFQVPK
jgi:hypothetical protein